MIMRKLLKLLQRVYRYYTHEEVDHNQWKQLLSHVGEHSVIHFPAIISVDKRFSIGDDTTILSNSRIQNYGANAANTPPPWAIRCIYRRSLLYRILFFCAKRIYCDNWR